jgi:peptide deformylase
MLIPSNDQLLHRPANTVSEEQFINYKNSIQPIASMLIAEIYEKNALGVSAVQMGVDMSMFAMMTEAQPKVCINPEIVAASFEMVLMEEGCLSFPGLHLQVKRPAGIVARYKTIEGQEVTERLEGMDARVWLHEYDHCQGICFTDRVSKLKLSMAKKRLEKRNKRSST